MAKVPKRKITQRHLYAHMREVFTSIQNDIYAPLQFHERNGGGVFSIAALCFLNIEYLGSLIHNHEKTTQRARKFLEVYMGRVDCRYEWYQRLLVDMWRNGIAHERDPKHYETIYLGNVVELHWSLNNSSAKENREQHLRCIQKLRIGKDRPTYVLNVNLFELVKHLILALDLLLQDLIANREMITCPRTGKKQKIRTYAISRLQETMEPQLARDISLQGEIKIVLDSHDDREFLDPSRLWVRKWSEVKS